MLIVISWIGMAFSLVRAYLLARHKLGALYWSLFVDTWWIAWAAASGVWALLALNCIYVLLDARTIIIWRQGTEKNKL